MYTANSMKKVTKSKKSHSEPTMARKFRYYRGLTPGDRIVTRGAYQVKMASASAAIPGHTHEH